MKTPEKSDEAIKDIEGSSQIKGLSVDLWLVEAESRHGTQSTDNVHDEKVFICTTTNERKRRKKEDGEKNPCDKTSTVAIVSSDKTPNEHLGSAPAIQVKAEKFDVRREAEKPKMKHILSTYHVWIEP